MEGYSPREFYIAANDQQGKRIEPNVAVAWQVHQKQGPGAWVCH